MRKSPRQLIVESALRELRKEEFGCGYLTEARVKVTKVNRGTDKNTGALKIQYEGETPEGEVVKWNGQWTGSPYDILRVGQMTTVFPSEFIKDEEVKEFEDTTKAGFERPSEPKTETIMVDGRHGTVREYSRMDLEDELDELIGRLDPSHKPRRKYDEHGNVIERDTNVYGPEPAFDYVGVSSPEGQWDVDVANAQRYADYWGDGDDDERKPYRPPTEKEREWIERRIRRIERLLAQ